MNKITNKFLIFKTKDGFIKKYNKRLISPDSIVFIKEDGSIWTHNQYFGLSTGGIEKGKGYFSSVEDLTRRYPNPQIGDWAIVGSATVDGQESQWVIASCTNNGRWDLTTHKYDQQYFDIDEYVKKADLDLSKYITDDALDPYAKTSDVQLTYLTKNEFYQQIQRIIAQSASNPVTVDSQLSITSTNPVENKVITSELNKKLEESDLEGYAKSTDVRSLVNDRIQEILDALADGDEDYNIREDLINEKIQELKDLVDEINEKYISWGVDEQGEGGQGGGHDHEPINTSGMITLSDEEYQFLVENDAVDPNTYYFTYSKEDYPDTWTFGGKFPITFTEQWAFGGTFPITLQ